MVFGSTRILDLPLLEDKERVLIEALVGQRRKTSSSSANSHAPSGCSPSNITMKRPVQFTKLVSQRAPAAGQEFVIVTGGGPGIMEAANRGAWDAEAPSIGLNITLAARASCRIRTSRRSSAFVSTTSRLRKMHFLLRAKALVVFPGGFGTLDELFDALTLRQTRRMQEIPIILYGREYWEQVIDFQFLADEGTISDVDLDLISYADTPDEAWQHIATFHGFTAMTDAASARSRPMRAPWRWSPAAAVASDSASPDARCARLSTGAAREWVDRRGRESRRRAFAAAGCEAIAVRRRLARCRPPRGDGRQRGRDHFGRIDALVNNAAIWESKPLDEVTPEDVREHFEINTLGTFVCCQQAGLLMARRPTGGAIVNIGDWAIERPYPNHAAYFVAKGSIPTLTRTLAVELGLRNPRVRVNAVLPGPVLMPEGTTTEEQRRMIDATLVKRWGTVEELAEAVLSAADEQLCDRRLPAGRRRTQHLRPDGKRLIRRSAHQRIVRAMLGRDAEFH